jgi:hypothetical protein
MKKIVSLLAAFAFMFSANAVSADNTIDRTNDDSTSVISTESSKAVTNEAYVSVGITNRYDGRLNANVSSNSGLNAFVSGGDIERTTSETGDADTKFDSSVLANTSSSDVWVEQESCACDENGSTHNSIGETDDGSDSIIETIAWDTRDNKLTLDNNTTNEANDNTEVALASNTGGNLFDAKNDIEDSWSKTGAPSTHGSLSREFNRVNAVLTVKQR